MVASIRGVVVLGRADVPGWGKVGTTDIGVHRLGEFGAPSAGGDQLQLLFIGNGQNFGSTFQDLTSPIIGVLNQALNNGLVARPD